MTQPDDKVDVYTISVLELKEEMLPDELVPYSQLYIEASWLWCQVDDEQDSGEGFTPNPYLGPAVERMKPWLDNHGLDL